MRLDHIAMWTDRLEETKNFYVKHFNGVAESLFVNRENQFQSYFVGFKNGVRLEIMQMPGIPANLNDVVNNQHQGLIHIAFSVGSRIEVDQLTEELRGNQISVVEEGVEYPDGYYESVVLDPGGNRVEISYSEF